MREVYRDGVRWTVREASTASIPGAKSHHCLIFDSEGVVRRLWAYPDDWAQLGDKEIVALLDTPTPAFGTQAISNTGEHPAFAAAIAAHAHSQALAAELASVRDSTRVLREERRQLLESCRAGRVEMRLAIEQYVKTLRQGGVPPERAVRLLKSAIEDGLGSLEGREAPDSADLIGDGVRWGIEAYYAA
jgi:hypothetical protein